MDTWEILYTQDVWELHLPQQISTMSSHDVTPEAVSLLQPQHSTPVASRRVSTTQDPTGQPKVTSGRQDEARNTTRHVKTDATRPTDVLVQTPTWGPFRPKPQVGDDGEGFKRHPPDVLPPPNSFPRPPGPIPSQNGPNLHSCAGFPPSFGLSPRSIVSKRCGTHVPSSGSSTTLVSTRSDAFLSVSGPTHHKMVCSPSLPPPASKPMQTDAFLRDSTCILSRSTSLEVRASEPKRSKASLAGFDPNTAMSTLGSGDASHASPEPLARSKQLDVVTTTSKHVRNVENDEGKHLQGVLKGRSGQDVEKTRNALENAGKWLANHSTTHYTPAPHAMVQEPSHVPPNVSKSTHVTSTVAFSTENVNGRATRPPEPSVTTYSREPPRQKPVPHVVVQDVMGYVSDVVFPTETVCYRASNPQETSSTTFSRVSTLQAPAPPHLVQESTRYTSTISVSTENECYRASSPLLPHIGKLQCTDSYGPPNTYSVSD